MPDSQDPTRYGPIAQGFHWVIAALIVTQFTLASLADDLPIGMQKLMLIARHKSFGMTVLMLAVLRLVWRLLHRAPPLPVTMRPIEMLLARATHLAFYVLLFAMPLTGWLMSSAKGYTVSWFSLFSWPDLIAKNEAAFDFLHGAHEVLGNVLLAIAILHVAAALKHQFWDKDNVLRRMLPFTKS